MSEDLEAQDLSPHDDNAAVEHPHHHHHHHHHPRPPPSHLVTDKKPSWYHHASSTLRNISRKQKPTNHSSGDDGGMAINQDVALANLDPRSQARDLGQGQTAKLGTSTHAVAGDVDYDDDDDTRESKRNVPDQGICISQGWKLESTEKGEKGEVM